VEKRESTPQDYDEQSRSWRGNATLEGELQGSPANGEMQKALMLMYNRALSVYAKSHTHREEIDALFMRIDELRNIIRRNI
jgi:hypothetical protein